MRSLTRIIYQEIKTLSECMHSAAKLISRGAQEQKSCAPQCTENIRRRHINLFPCIIMLMTFGCWRFSFSFSSYLFFSLIHGVAAACSSAEQPGCHIGDQSFIIASKDLRSISHIIRVHISLHTPHRA